MNVMERRRSTLLDEIAAVEKAVECEPLTTPGDDGRELNPRLVDLVLREYDAVRELLSLVDKKQLASHPR